MRTTTRAVVIGLAVCLLALLPLAAQAQVTRTGVIQGQITDPEGLPLPGAMVTIASPQLIGGEQMATTGADGRYRFPALPPGNYTVEASLQGFETQLQEQVRVSVSLTATVNFSLVIGVTDTVTVLGASPVVDIRTSSSANTTMTEEVFQTLPSGRSAAGLIDFIPGVVGDEGTLRDGRGASAFGGTLQGTQFTFDGVMMNSTEGGEVEVRLDFDNVEEASFRGIGAAAEVGGYSGMVVNLVTKSGSNEVHGQANFFYRGDNWNAENADLNGNGQIDPEEEEFVRDTNNNRNWHVDIGGPLVRDKLWAYGSFRRDVSNFSTDVTQGEDGYNRTYQWLAKLTWQPTQDIRLQGSLNWENEDAKDPDDLFVAPEATLAPFGTWKVFNVDYLHVLSENTFLDMKFGGVDSAYGDFPDSQTFGPGYYEIETDYLSESPGFFFDAWRNRYQLNVSLSHYADDFLAGSHDIKAGFMGDWAKPRTWVGYTGNAFYVTYGGEPAYRYEFQSLDIDPLGTTLSFFVQDGWITADGRLTINAGLRFNSWTGNAKAELGPITGYPAGTVDLGDHFKPDLGIAPRIGATFDLFGDGTTAIKFHWGKYYPQLIAGMYAGFQSFPAVEFQFSEWNGDEYEVIESEVVNAIPVDPNLKMTNFTEFSIGVARELAPNVSAEVTYIRRDTHDFQDKVRLNGIWNQISAPDHAGNPTQLWDLLNAEDGVFLITNPEEIGDVLAGTPLAGFEQSRKFWGLNFALEKRYSDGWGLSGSYVYSKSEGTDDTDFENGRGSSLGPSDLWTDPNTHLNAFGPLFSDVPHQLKFVGTFLLPLEIQSAFFYNYKTGLPYTRNYTFVEVRENERSIEAWTEPRGSYRLPNQNNFNLRFEKIFPIKETDLGVLLDVFNLFNSNTAIRVRTDDDPRSDNEFQQLRRIKFPLNVVLGFRWRF
jgi:hypothetical protein